MYPSRLSSWGTYLITRLPLHGGGVLDLKVGFVNVGEGGCRVVGEAADLLSGGYIVVRVARKVRFQAPGRKMTQ